MNTSKTEFIMFGSRKQLNKCAIQTIDFADGTVKKVYCMRYLGAFLDETLNFNENVTRKCKTVLINFFRIKRIR